MSLTGCSQHLISREFSLANAVAQQGLAPSYYQRPSSSTCSSQFCSKGAVACALARSCIAHICNARSHWPPHARRPPPEHFVALTVAAIFSFHPFLQVTLYQNNQRRDTILQGCRGRWMVCVPRHQPAPTGPHSGSPEGGKAAHRRALSAVSVSHHGRCSRSPT